MQIRFFPKKNVFARYQILTLTAVEVRRTRFSLPDRRNSALT